MQTIPGMWYSPRGDAPVEITEDHANYFHMHQTLMGDQVDNYTGIPGVGPANAKKILEATDGTPQARWEAVVDAYGKAGLEESDALIQARCAHLLHWDDYNMKTKEVRLWKPDKLIQEG